MTINPDYIPVAKLEMLAHELAEPDFGQSESVHTLAYKIENVCGTNIPMELPGQIFEGYQDSNPLRSIRSSRWEKFSNAITPYHLGRLSKQLSDEMCVKLPTISKSKAHLLLSICHHLSDEDKEHGAYNRRFIERVLEALELEPLSEEALQKSMYQIANLTTTLQPKYAQTH